MGVRIPSAAVIGVGALFFLLYLLPWQRLPNLQVPIPSPFSLPSSGGGNLSLFWGWDYEEDAVKVPGFVSYKSITTGGGARFNLSGSDVLVILHIQKTGGTSFEKHIVQDLVIERPCVCWKKRKRCKCQRPLVKGRGGGRMLFLS